MRGRASAWAGSVVLLGVFVGGADCLPEDGGEPPECTARCDIEAECGLRTLEDCQAAACDKATGEPLSLDADTCLANAADCLEAAACACTDGCARIDACADAEAPSETCANDCATLVTQVPNPEQTYQENRCRIEAAECSDLATCTAVSG